MNVKRTRMVSFPRSGHHWLLRMLRSNLGSYIRYGNFHDELVTLETHPHVNVQTEHDLRLEAPVNLDFQHVVQYRLDKEAAIQSVWRLGHDAEYCSEQFFQARSLIYDGWKAKWVDSNIPNRLIITYEDMLENPLKELHRAYVFLTGAEPPILVVELARPGLGHFDMHTDEEG